MKNIFIIVGYGIPKNIFKDENYNFYLKMAYNQIWDIVSNDNIEDPVVIFSGGKTSLYNKRQSEAGEMLKFFKKTFKPEWELFKEDESLSSLENLILCEKIIKRNFNGKNNIYLIGEKTRKEKLTKLAKEVFKKTKLLKIIPVDFDVTPLRYLTAKEIKERHDADTKFSLKAVKDKKLLKKHHQIFKERLDYLRKNKNRDFGQNLNEWWDDKLEELYKLAK